MRVVAFLTEYPVFDLIICYLELAFVAAKSPPSQVFKEVAPTTAKRARKCE